MEVSLPVYRKTPFLRPLLALVMGMIAANVCNINSYLLVVSFCASLAFLLCFHFLPIAVKFRLKSLNGLFVNLCIASLGALLLFNSDIRNQKNFIGRRSGYTSIIGTVSEAPVMKAHTLKTVIRIRAIVHGSTCGIASGRVIAYLRLDSLMPPIADGSQIIFRRPLIEICNSGNPGSFDYKSYCNNQGITHQVLLSSGSYTVVPPETNRLERIVQSCRSYTLQTLSACIPGNKEKGLSEALLIGYKEDLDKQLLQAYTNTGVVHIIAISGGHLAVVYGWLLFLTAPLKRRRSTAWLQTCLILAGLWLFTLVTGSQASIVRSAIMFSCLVCGRLLNRRHTAYNALACAAFLSLAYNPFWLWDAGWQLSYAAVLSILVCFKPLYSAMRFQNKIVDGAWKLVALTLAAQAFTMPLCLYYFHQFPLLFLFTNLLAVPLSGLIISAEIFLCVIGFMPMLAQITGKAIHWGLVFLNTYIERLDHVSFALWQGISLSLPETVLLMLACIAITWWLLKRSVRTLQLSLLALLFLSIIRAASFFKASQQQKLIVYNLPRYTAVEVVQGSSYTFLGDPAAFKDMSAINYTFSPAHAVLRIKNRQTISPFTRSFCIRGNRYLIVDKTANFRPQQTAMPLNTLILSHNPRCSIVQLTQTFQPLHVVADATVPAYKALRWQRECDSLHIHFHNVRTQGALVIDL